MIQASRALCLLVVSVAGWGQAASPAPVQDAAQQPVTTLKVVTGLVAISAVVKSKDGEAKTGLTKDDFVLKQDGKEQPIRFFFSRVRSTPKPGAHGGHQRQPANVHRG